jgi:hypothetical protein
VFVGHDSLVSGLALWCEAHHGGILLRTSPVPAQMILDLLRRQATPPAPVLCPTPAEALLAQDLIRLEIAADGEQTPEGAAHFWDWYVDLAPVQREAVEHLLCSLASPTLARAVQAIQAANAEHGFLPTDEGATVPMLDQLDPAMADAIKALVWDEARLPPLA